MDGRREKPGAQINVELARTRFRDAMRLSPRLLWSPRGVWALADRVADIEITMEEAERAYRVARRDVLQALPR